MANKLDAIKLRLSVLEMIVKDFHWMARRYCDGRSSYAPALFNEHTQRLLDLGIILDGGSDGTIWAGDGVKEGNK